MEHKEASNILINLVKKDVLSPDETEAVLTAIGVLAWTSLASSRIKSMGEKRKKLKGKI